MINNLIEKWQKKNTDQKKLFLEACFYLFNSRILLLLFPFKKIIVFHKLENAENTNKNNLIEPILLKNISWSVRTAAKFAPFQSLCLVQALAAQKMLQRRQLTGYLFLGLKKDEHKISGLAAHAWVTCNNSVITGGGPYLEKYSVISAYSWH